MTKKRYNSIFNTLWKGWRSGGMVCCPPLLSLPLLSPAWGRTKKTKTKTKKPKPKYKKQKTKNEIKNCFNKTIFLRTSINTHNSGTPKTHMQPACAGWLYRAKQ